MEDSLSYRLPEGFNPYTTADTIRGLTDAIHRFLFEGPGTMHVIPDDDRAALDGLAALLQKEVQALHGYLREIDNRQALEFPMSEADFEALDDLRAPKDEVREPAADYSIQ